MSDTSEIEESRQRAKAYYQQQLKLIGKDNIEEYIPAIMEAFHWDEVQRGNTTSLSHPNETEYFVWHQTGCGWWVRKFVASHEGVDNWKINGTMRQGFWHYQSGLFITSEAAQIHCDVLNQK